MFRKICLLMLFLSLTAVFPFSAFAEDTPTETDNSSDGTSTGTVLPATDQSVDNCILIMESLAWPNNSKLAREAFKERKTIKFSEGLFTEEEISLNDILACGIKTGQIKLWLFPYYIRYILEFIISIAGLVSIGAFIYGGYVYLFAGLSDDKEKGKKAILYSVAGFVMTMLSWAFVNIIVALVT